MKLAKTYYDCRGSRSKIQVHQGGTRSGKTYSICLCLVELCYRNQDAGMVITICRKTFPALRASVMRDFIEILERENLYNTNDHNKSENLYNLFGNTVEFVSIDMGQKVRGRKRDVLFVNECNEIDWDSWQQLLLRTTWRTIVDFNPSDEYHWLYERVIPRDDAQFFKTTYLDNPFLSKEIVEEIERLKDTDEYYWTVYGLGERGVSKEVVFRTHEYEKLPENAKFVAYGMDWGFTNDPTALVGVYIRENEIYIEELIYQTRMTNPEIAEKMRSLEIDRHTEIIADSSEPKSIEEIHRMGFNIKPAKKGADSVRIGIDVMRRHKLFIKSDSLNVIKEFRNYKWMTDKNGKILNVPVDAFNHAVDAARYVCINKLIKKTGKYYIR